MENKKAKLIEMAKTHIKNESHLALDVAANYGQIFSNIKYMRWFLNAVVAELEQ